MQRRCRQPSASLPFYARDHARPAAASPGLDRCDTAPLGLLEFEDPRLEFLEHLLAALKPVLRLAHVWRAEPVAPADAIEPRADLVELNPDFLCFFVGEILSERLELDFLREVDFAVFNDLQVVVGGLI